MKIKDILTETPLSDLTSRLYNNFADIPVIRGQSKIANYSGRIIVLPIINGIHIPFYISTGSGGKLSVPTGKWYPFFGIGSNGWLNKGSEEDINRFYGSSILKTMAEYLNKTLGDLRSFADDSGGKPSVIPYILKTSFPTINQDLHPVRYWKKGDPEAHKLWQAHKHNIDQTLVAIGSPALFNKEIGNPKLKTSDGDYSRLAPDKVQGSITLTGNGVELGPYNLNFTLGRYLLKKLGDDSKYYSNEQAEFEKRGNNWFIKPISTATNKTIVDGRELTKDTILRKGMRISVGNVAKGIEKLPLIVG